ncbi:hypothetical protein JCM16408A_11630 [Methylobacterium phyllosphaerae]
MAARSGTGMDGQTNAAANGTMTQLPLTRRGLDGPGPDRKGNGPFRRGVHRVCIELLGFGERRVNRGPASLNEAVRMVNGSLPRHDGEARS